MNLTAIEQIQVYNLLDNIFTYAGISDCNANSSISVTIRNKTLDYLETISESYFSHTAVGEDPLIVLNSQFNVFLAKTTICSLFELKINFGDSVSPKLQLFQKLGASYDCN